MDHITVRSLSDGSTRRIFSSVYDGKQLALHPDGQTLVIAAARQLWRIDLASGERQAIPFEANLSLPARTAGNVVVGNARLFDGTGSETVEGTHVAVRDGRIARIWTGVIQLADTAGSDYVDAQGRFLMAGLFDNHFHYWHQWIFQANELLAQGITGIRDPGAEISESLNFRDAVRLGVIEGPDVYTLGPLLDGPIGAHPMVDVILDRPEAAGPVVRALKEQGVDGIKVYHSLEPQTLRAVVAEARAQGLPVTGDLGAVTRWNVAVDAGITGLNHGYVYRFGYLPDDVLPFQQDEPWEVAFARWQLMNFVRVDPDRPEIRGVLDRMARDGVAYDPTLVVGQTTDDARKQLGIERMEVPVRVLEDTKRFVRMAYDAGVTILAGTDNLSMFDELEHYESAGIPNADVLRTVTRNGAEWLGRGSDFGTVEVGKKGHLVLVDGDPLTKMKDLRNVEVVIKDGRVVVVR
jgi:hypothetical protein